MDALVTTPCTVMHVRRSDVVLHTTRARQYFALSDYVKWLRRNDTIFLLTDDANAIEEAFEFHPNLKWTFLNRTRFRGTEGGWENQTPSRSPKREVVVIMALLRLVQRCDTLIHTSSGFARMLARAMQPTLRTRIQIDSHMKREEQYSWNNTVSHHKLNKTLHELREQKKKSSI